MKSLRKWLTKRPTRRPARTAAPGLEQLEDRQLLSGNPISAGAAAIGSVLGTASSDPRYLTTVGKVLYFTADDGVHGQELWKTNGTAAGTAMVDDINTLPAGLSAAAVDAALGKKT